MTDSITLIRKYKRSRHLSIIAYFFSVLLLAFWNYSAVWELGYYEDSDKLFFYVQVAFYLIFILISVIFMFASMLIRSLIAKILYYESDPEKYGQVFFAVFRSNKKDVIVWQANAAFLTGRFEDCFNYCNAIKALNKQKLLFESAFNRARSAAMLGDKEMLADEIENMQWYSAYLKRKSAQVNAERKAGHLQMLLDLLEGNIEEAVKKADSFREVLEYPIDDALLSYYRGLVYRQAGQTVKAIHCFMTASEKGGKMFIKEKSDELLKELTAEPEPSGQPQA